MIKVVQKTIAWCGLEEF